MVSTDRARDDDARVARSEAQEAERVLEQKTNELLEFRDAGILTEAELEEQKAKLRWGIP
jgi:capsule polysaccharide export protein KpsE/RkpR